jgi:hypothetical protein
VAIAKIKSGDRHLEKPQKFARRRLNHLSSRLCYRLPAVVLDNEPLDLLNRHPVEFSDRFLPEQLKLLSYLKSLIKNKNNKNTRPY